MHYFECHIRSLTTFVNAQVCSDASNYGDVSLRDKTLQMTSINGMPCFELKLDNVAQCVVPANNRDELEIHFPENDGGDKDEDCLVQITLHFPQGDEDDEETPAQEFQKDIMSTGVIRSITGDIICEFTKEQGNFVTPRGKYGIQMLSSYMHMQGAQYSYKIKYTDITKTFLLDKQDGMRCFFVIVLDKPIRQGNQKYQYLVIETNKMEHNLQINLSEAEIAKDYDGQLQPVMVGPLANNIAKVFKVLAQITVFVPKTFKSFRDEYSVRSTYKTNEGLIYPLAKCLIFVHKPTIIINYDDIASVELQRYVQSASSATRAFDLEVTLKKKDGGGESKYLFVSIDRAEGPAITDFLGTKNVTVINPQAADKKAKGAFAGMDDGDDDEDDEEEDDGDYKAGQSSGSENDSDDSGVSDADQEGDDEEKPKKKRSAAPAKSPKTTSREKKSKDKEPAKKKAKKVKDKNAPKKNLSAYFMFTQSTREALKQERPGMSVTETAKELGVRWKELAAEDREPYEEMAKLDKQRYEREMEVYNAKKKESDNLMEIGSDADGDDAQNSD